MFHDALFPTTISYGSKGGPRFSTTVLTLASGKERRNQNWLDVRAEYDVSHGIKDAEDMMELREFFYARRGRAYSFRFFDHADNKVLNQTLGTGDDEQTDFQIIKTYSPATNPYTRTITKPVEGTLVGIHVGANEMTEYPWLEPGTDEYIDWLIGLDDETEQPLAFMCNYNTGVIHFPNAPAAGESVYLGVVDFHVHVRFDTDVFDAVHDFWLTESWEQILLVEIKDAV